MKFRFLLATAAAMALPTAIQASPPMSGEDIAVLRSALPVCGGGWSEYAESGIVKISPGSLVPRLDLLARPSGEIDEGAGEELYQIAKAFLAPATGTPDWLLDGKPSLTCAPRPKEAIALMEYLAGSGPADRRGAQKKAALSASKQPRRVLRKPLAGETRMGRSSGKRPARSRGLIRRESPGWEPLADERPPPTCGT